VSDYLFEPAYLGGSGAVILVLISLADILSAFFANVVNRNDIHRNAAFLAFAFPAFFAGYGYYKNQWQKKKLFHDLNSVRNLVISRLNCNIKEYPLIA
jgi:hypothetical protein